MHCRCSLTRAWSPAQVWFSSMIQWHYLVIYIPCLPPRQSSVAYARAPLGGSARGNVARAFTMGAGASSRKAAVAMLKDKQATVAKLTFEEMDTDNEGTRTASSRVKRSRRLSPSTSRRGSPRRASPALSRRLTPMATASSTGRSLTRCSTS